MASLLQLWVGAEGTFSFSEFQLLLLLFLFWPMALRCRERAPLHRTNVHQQVVSDGKSSCGSRSRCLMLTVALIVRHIVFQLQLSNWNASMTRSVQLFCLLMMLNLQNSAMRCSRWLPKVHESVVKVRNLDVYRPANVRDGLWTCCRFS